MDTAPWLLLAIVAVVAVVLLGLWRWERGRLSRRTRARQRVASRGEAEAEDLLEDHGYAIVDRQVAGGWTMLVDGLPVDLGCRADLLVRGAGGLFVAEVKTGALAPDPSRPATRRQLLEYLYAFDVDGVLLVDMVARRIHEVRFPDAD